MNLVPFNGSLAALFDTWFFSLPASFWLLMAIMGAISIASYAARQLTGSGAFAAFLVGFGSTWVLGFGSLATLLFFFITAGILNKLSKRLRGKEMSKIHAKGGRRDAMQVWANGLFALLGALLYALDQSPVYLVMFATSVAEAASDTFAGDVGILSKREPVSIITGRPMRRGLSGAVSPLGLVSGMLGAILIALTAWSLLLTPDRAGAAGASVIAIAAFFGCLIDSVLGATIQAHWWDEESNTLTEHPTKNGKPLPLERGIRWIDNDMVNLLSNATATLLAFSLMAIFS
ncbi:MAG: DUF92 domain-containing protein [Sphaerochaeta sp.]|jgi:uncharacterized protein (TIGR00297 family)|nr:DUF92 domain-containing protein [Spirochaetales bacterium]